MTVSVTDEQVEAAVAEFCGGLSGWPHQYAAMRRVLEQFAETSLQKVQTTPAPQPAAGWVMVPKAALDWLLGEGPDAEGHWFGDGPDVQCRDKEAFWWRTKFRSMLASAPPPPDADVTNPAVTDARVHDSARTEREVCAKIAACQFDNRPRSRAGNIDYEDGYREGTSDAAAAIRNQGAA